MIGLIQRVTEARVEVQSRIISKINTGLLVLVGVEKQDTHAKADRLLERILSYRVFPDDAGKMNLSLTDVLGGLLLVPQFTLPADTNKGTRPSFSSSAPPELGEDLFNHLLSQAQLKHTDVKAGKFGADMKVHLVNDGPVTFWLQV